MRFSVIVPVYGAEKYLDQCIISILNQKFRDFELILVDDCSLDRCPAMCDAWAEKDDRICVIHKPVNEGLGFARNTGIQAAKGEYILFVDSDDYISEVLLKTCDDKLTEQTDIFVFGLQYVYQNRHGKTTLTEDAMPQTFSALTQEDRAQMFAQLNQAGAFPFACNKAYRKAFLDDVGVAFEKTKLIEDFLFNIALFGAAGRIDSIPDLFYFYRKPAHETLVSRYAPEFFELSKRKYRLEQEFLSQCGCLGGAHLDLIRLGYVKHVVSAVLKNRSAAAALPMSEQKAKICQMMDDPLTVEVVKDLNLSDWKFRPVCEAIRNRRVNQMMLFCMGIHLLQKNMLGIYRKLLKK